MKLAPLGNRITVEPELSVSKTKTGLFIPESVKAREKPQKGVVLQVGEEVTDVKPGDKILFGKGSGMEVKVNEQEFYIIRSCDVFAIIED